MLLTMNNEQIAKDCKAVLARMAANDVQPVSFIEFGTGLRMRIGKWYVVSDSGSHYTDRAFNSASHALDWWATSEWVAAPESNELSDCIVPKYAGYDAGWDDMGAANVLFADDLLDFWLHDETASVDELSIEYAQQQQS